ncbi:hypothetical protein EBT31_03215 [bacterium]|nr:hypothetical protein [bacterium]NBX50672.1 hypothetical protein [bacterium]
MPLPDLTGPKVLYPALLFAALKSLSRTDSITGALLFGIAYVALLRFVVQLTFKPADIAVSSVLFWALSPGTFVTLPPGGTGPTAIAAHTLVFAIVLAFLRATFPRYY